MMLLSPQEVQLFRWIYALPFMGCGIGLVWVSFVSHKASFLFELLADTVYALPVYLPFAVFAVWRIPKYTKMQNIGLALFLPLPFSVITGVGIAFWMLRDDIDFLKWGLDFFRLSFAVSFYPLIVAYLYVAIGLLIVLAYQMLRKNT